ncbi:efflux transporter outer membrane subunit [Sphingobium sp. CR2-8]|uniref:efflux transporter outer membrane subunit n=1 Tax=Sphingobium sp. CR2-8 TaxID=1306534 RepID=UPI002DBB9586|nr:efflux transporter outer membrane subunit [Sphingobium sp. CR2-8]MEC3909491.1 efflux transporter outer membrane subunit [Sphingobium sp. CR2-8]
MRRYLLAGGPIVQALALTACTPDVRPIPPSAAITAPLAWRDAAPGPTVGVEADWWRRLNDPFLPDLIARALANNSDVLGAVARVEEAEAVVRQTAAERMPTVDAGGSLGGQQGLGQAGTGPLSLSAQPQMSAAWTLDLFNRVRALEGAARAHYVASQADRDAARLAVISATVRGYVSLLSLAAQLHVSRETLTSRQEALRIAKDRAILGYSSQFELTQAQSEYEAVAQTIPDLEQAYRVQENALRRLTGDLPGDIARGELRSIMLPAVPAALPSTILRRRPDLASAEYALVAADLKLASRRAEFLPSVHLTGSVGALFANGLDWNPATLWNAGASVLAPIFAGGRLTANLNTASAQRDQAAFAYRGAVLTAFGEVENALSSERLLRQKADNVMQRQTILQRSLTLARDRYRGGYAAYIEELDAQRNLLQVDLDAIRVREQQLNNLVQLWASLGGGWEARDALTLPSDTSGPH